MVWFDLWCLTPLSTIFQLYRSSQGFIGWWIPVTRWKPPTCRKSLTNFITYWFYLNNFIGYHTVTWHSVKFDIVWLKLVLTWVHFHFHFSFWCNKTITVFCIGQYEFLWTLERLRWISFLRCWRQQKTIIVYYHIMLYWVHLNINGVQTHNFIGDRHWLHILL
jgi:hypothetical protein